MVEEVAVRVDNVGVVVVIVEIVVIVAVVIVAIKDTVSSST